MLQAIFKAHSLNLPVLTEVHMQQRGLLGFDVYKEVYKQCQAIFKQAGVIKSTSQPAISQQQVLPLAGQQQLSCQMMQQQQQQQGTVPSMQQPEQQALYHMACAAAAETNYRASWIARSEQP